MTLRNIYHLSVKQFRCAAHHEQNTINEVPKIIVSYSDGLILHTNGIVNLTGIRNISAVVAVTSRSPLFIFKRSNQNRSNKTTLLCFFLSIMELIVYFNQYS